MPKHETPTAEVPLEDGAPPEPEKPPQASARLVNIMHRVLRKQQPEMKVDAAFVLLVAVMYGGIVVEYEVLADRRETWQDAQLSSVMVSGAVLYFSIGSAFLPGHPAWMTLTLWAAANIGALVAYEIYFPRVLGMLVAGILMRNLPWDAVSGFPPKWGVQMRAAALATIFLRCGLELDFNTMKRFKYPAMRLALVPGMCEALFDAGVATAPAVFGMPFLLSLTMGFILKAVGPGLVVPAMFQLQKAGMGKDQGIPSTIVISASFDDIIAITGFAIFSNLAITGAGDVGWQIAQGPLQVIFGIVGGIIGGFLLGCTRMFNGTLVRFVGLYGGALLLMFFLEYYNMLSGGAIGALTIGLVASNSWEKGLPRFGSSGPSFEYSPTNERVLAIIWTWVMEPMLFVTIGSSIDFSTIGGGTIPRSILIVCTGVVLRMIITYFCMMGFGYSTRERVFFSLAWTPKATVQAALSATPLTMIELYKKGSPDYDQWVEWGNDILTTGLFAIIICATLGMLAIYISVPHLLQKAEEGADGIPTAEAHGHGTMSTSGTENATEVPCPSRPAHSNDSGSPRKVELRPLGSGLRTMLPPPRTRPIHRVHSSTHAAFRHADYELVAAYIDTIRQLTVAASEPASHKEELPLLAMKIVRLQQAIEDEIGEREMTVRELFRTASRMSDMHPAPRTTAMPHTASLTGVSGEQSASSRRSQRELRRKGSL